MLARILDIGADPAEPDLARARRRAAVAASLGILPIGAIWAAIYLAFGEPVAAAAPGAYVPLTLASVAAFARDRRFGPFRDRQLAIVLVLPFLLHLALGGFVASSGAILWSVLAAFGALVFCGPREGARWLGAFLLLVVVAALGPQRPPPAGVPERAVGAFFALNVATITAVAFALLATTLDQLDRARADAERLLLNVLPPVIAERLKRRPGVIADPYPAATIVFIDVVGSTRLTTELSPAELVTLLNEYVARFDELADAHGIEKIRTIGDNWMGVAGVPRQRPDHAIAAARFALGCRAYCAARTTGTARSLRFRTGMDTGPVVGGVIGRRKFVFDIWGDAVNTASRMESTGEPERVQITERCYEILRDRFLCEPRGTVEVKGKGDMRTWWLVAERG